MIVKYSADKKSDVMVMPVELLYADKAVKNIESAIEYAKDRIGRIIGKTVDEVSFPLGLRKIKVNTMLSLDGFRVCISGSAGGDRILFMPHVPFSAPYKVNYYIKKIECFAEKIKYNPNYIYSEKQDKVSVKENIELYDLYIDKLQNSIYKKRPSNPLKTLITGKDRFISLDVNKQAFALLSIHQVFGRVAGGCDLSLIDGSKTEAKSRISSKISNWKKQYSDVRIIDCSTTGLWERVSDNLLDLV